MLDVQIRDRWGLGAGVVPSAPRLSMPTSWRGSQKQEGHWMAKLAEACKVWQSGRDGGSSRLRGAARVLTGIPHYFHADFITAHELAARDDPEAMDNADVLLRAVGASEALTAAERRERCSLPTGDFAGRGLASKPQDDQIEAVLESREITMPLWGVSLDRTVADSFGMRFLFVLEGPFHGVAAWTQSGDRPDQLEIITGGHYRVTDLHHEDGSTIATLTEVGQIAAMRRQRSTT
jgi:hypothetical protein